MRDVSLFLLTENSRYDAYFIEDSILGVGRYERIDDVARAGSIFRFEDFCPAVVLY